MVDLIDLQQQALSSGAVPETLEPGRKFYAYHVTKESHFLANSKRVSRKRNRMQESKRGMMGRGVYCTTDFFKVRAFGEYVLILEFVPCASEHGKPAGVVVKERKDPRSNWRRDNYNGVYVPAGTASRRSELCIRWSCITGVWDWHIPGEAEGTLQPDIENGRERVEATAALFEQYC